MDEAVVENQQSDQTQTSSAPESEVPSAVGHADQEQRPGRQEVEAEHSDSQPEGETPQDHREQKVSSHAPQVFFT